CHHSRTRNNASRTSLLLTWVFGGPFRAWGPRLEVAPGKPAGSHRERFVRRCTLEKPLDLSKGAHRPTSQPAKPVKRKSNPSPNKPRFRAWRDGRRFSVRRPSHFSDSDRVKRPDWLAGKPPPFPQRRSI